MKKPAPISMSVAKKPPRKKVVSPINQVAADPVVKDRIVTKIVKDKALEHRVRVLEETGAKEIIVTIPARPRISKVAIKYDPFGAPEELIPTYGD